MLLIKYMIVTVLLSLIVSCGGGDPDPQDLKTIQPVHCAASGCTK